LGARELAVAVLVGFLELLEQVFIAHRLGARDVAVVVLVERAESRLLVLRLRRLVIGVSAERQRERGDAQQQRFYELHCGFSGFEKRESTFAVFMPTDNGPERLSHGSLGASPRVPSAPSSASRAPGRPSPCWRTPARRSLPPARARRAPRPPPCSRCRRSP